MRADARACSLTFRGQPQAGGGWGVEGRKNNEEGLRRAMAEAEGRPGAFGGLRVAR